MLSLLNTYALCTLSNHKHILQLQSLIDTIMTSLPPIPKTTKQWTVTGQNGFDSLKFSEESIPELGDNQVLVKSM